MMLLPINTTMISHAAQFRHIVTSFSLMMP